MTAWQCTCGEAFENRTQLRHHLLVEAKSARKANPDAPKFTHWANVDWAKADEEMRWPAIEDWEKLFTTYMIYVYNNEGTTYLQLSRERFIGRLPLAIRKEAEEAIRKVHEWIEEKENEYGEVPYPD